MKPELSIVIPVFNSEEWIEATLRSVERQTISADRFEIILVDNGSCDAGLIVAQSFLSDARVPFDIIPLDQNLGPSFARNIGWKSARGEWIQFLDSDDLLAPRKLEHQLREADCGPSGQAAIYSEWQSWCLDGTWQPKLPVMDTDLGEDVIRSLLETGSFVHLGSQIFRRDWLEKVNGFDERHWLIEDVDLNLRLVMAGGMLFRAPANEPLFFYRRRGADSLSRSRPLEFINGCVRNLRLAEDYWHLQNILTEERRDFLLACYEPLLHNLAATNLPSFETLLEHILSLSPDWRPQFNRKMMIAARLFGYRRAERLSIGFRAAKAALGIHRG